MKLAQVVIIEDEVAIREGVAAALRGAGYEVTEAVDGKTGWRRPGGRAWASFCSI